MKIGVHLPTFGPHATPENILLVARTAEDLGFSSVWLFDHIVTPVGIQTAYPYSAEGKYGLKPEDPYYEAVTVMAYLAAATSRVTIGANVLVPTLRHPLLLAKQLASVDRLSGGRVVVGVGAGWLREEFDALQVPFERRGTRLEEHIQVMRNLWENTVAAHDGPSYPHAALGLSPTPHAEGGRIPIIIGGHSDRALRRVARIGDGWAVVASPAADMLAAYAERLATLRRMCQEVGRDFDELMLVAQVPATIGVPILEQIAALGVHVCDLVSFGRPELTAKLLATLPTSVG